MNAPTSLIPLVEANPAMVLVDAEQFDRFYEEVAREVRAHVPDLTTASGRKAIASLAFRVARTKTAIDDAGKKLNEEARAKINLVDASRRTIRDKLDALRDEARKPLDEWEAAEEARAEACKEITDSIRRDAVVTMEDTPETVAGRLALIQLVEIDAAEFGDDAPIAKALQRNAIESLTAAHARLEREAADRVELARLRAESEARAAKEAAEAAAAETAAREAREAEEKAAAAERAEAKRQADIAAAARAAEDAARFAAETAAREAAAIQQRAHDEALAAEKRRADEAEAAAETKRRGEAAEAAEVAKREKNRAHRSRVLGEVKVAVMAHGIGETAAKAVCLAIAAGEVPHVSIQF